MNLNSRVPPVPCVMVPAVPLFCSSTPSTAHLHGLVCVCVMCQCHFLLLIQEASQDASCVKTALQSWVVRAFVSSVLCAAAMTRSLGVSEGEQVNPFKGVLWGSLQQASLLLDLLHCISQHQ